VRLLVDPTRRDQLDGRHGAAGFAGILITPISGLNPTSFTLFIVPALGAALLGRMTSFSATVVAGSRSACSSPDDEARLAVRLVADERPAGGLALPRDHRRARRVRSVDPMERDADRSRDASRRASEARRALGRSASPQAPSLFTLGSTLRLGLIQSLIMIVLGCRSSW
jgi:hypothetical protein